MAERYVALFRGINVGKAKRIAMSDLRILVEGLGCSEVCTVLNSGNVVLTAPKGGASTIASRIEKAVEKKLGVASRVTILAMDEVSDAVERNPLAKIADDPARLLVLVPWDTGAHAQLKPMLEEPWDPEAMALGKRVAYLWCATGILKSPLWTATNKLLKDRGTARNITTMGKVLGAMRG